MTIKRYYFQESFYQLLHSKTTLHSQDRMYRVDKLPQNDTIMNAFLVDREHKDGPEIHYITKRARIIIINAYSKRLITILNARPRQIARYYNAVNMQVPGFIMSHARNNKFKGLNV